MPKQSILTLFALLLLASAKAQLTKPVYVGSIDEAKASGITITYLDGLYKSAVHVDSTKAVFNTEAGSDSLMNAYTRFLKDLGTYLKENNFKWEQPTRCWNRIYFNANGSVDYYLFDFKTSIGDEKANRFKTLFTAYAQTHKIHITAPVNFAQCSPVVFTEK